MKGELFVVSLAFDAMHCCFELRCGVTFETDCYWQDFSLLQKYLNKVLLGDQRNTPYLGGSLLGNRFDH